MEGYEFDSKSTHALWLKVRLQMTNLFELFLYY
jgi:hypothetical protein